MSAKAAKRSNSNGAVGIAAVVIALWLAGTHPSALKHAGTSLDSLSAAPIPASGSYTPRSWARTFLAAIPEPRTPCNVGAVVAWEAAEGGAWHNAATANPLDTTLPEAGSYKINDLGNGIGVQAFPSWQEGLTANVTVIRHALYAGVRAALDAGNNAQAVADAVTASHWGTGSFTANC